MAWTEWQDLAIKTRDRTLLVSAAAGSGKTATLTERIIQSILDKDNPQDIGRMLIATYTNAAVDELRERIGKAIKTAAESDPENARLEEQLLRLKDAKITTITSFCNGILRSAAESVGISPTYRIAEPAEAKIIANKILEGLINDAYEGELTEVCTADEFILLADSLSNIRYAEGLAESIEFVFDKLKSCEGGIDTLIPLIEEYNPDKLTSIEETRYGSYAITYATEAFGEYREAYKNLIRIASAERLDQKNLDRAEGDLDFVSKAAEATEYSEIKNLLAERNPKRLTKSKGEESTDFYTKLQFLRGYLTEDIKEMKEDIFSYEFDEWREMYRRLYKILVIFYKFLKKYDSDFMAEKKKRAICEFSDVERYAYLSLYNPDGSTTELAGELREKFDSIYVDEYQDVNALQSKVFSAIAKPDNRFMVGDIKQSIYGFRAARPEIFADMKDNFPKMKTEGDYPYASIFMSDNFRCDEYVIDFVNGIFDRYFQLFAKNIGYVKEDRLNFKKIYPDGAAPVRIPPEIHLVEKLPKKSDETEDEQEALEAEEIRAAALEAKHITKKIALILDTGKLADGKKVEPKHIAVLMRSTKGELAEALVKELSAIGVSTAVTENGDLFMNKEVLLALSFLYSIDNPKKDVYLVALACSPLFDITYDEILKIKRSSDAESVWDAIIEYIDKHPDFEKGARFVGSLLRYRRLAEGMSTDALLSLIYKETGLLALAGKQGGRDNLILLHSYARKYEQSDFKGLYSFISYVNKLIEREEKFADASTGEDDNSVRIMTIHKSKGLEFPVTFLAGTSASLKGSSKSRIMLSDNFGIAMKYKDDSGLALVDNPPRTLLKNYLSGCEYEEELRVLYVALTRAREQLYIYGTVSADGGNDYIEQMNELSSILTPHFARKTKSLLDIIMTGKTIGKVVINTPSEVGADIDDTKNEPADEEEAAEDFAYSEAPLLTADEYYGRFEYTYPLKALETVPEKISVSKLSPTVLDSAEETEVTLEELLILEGIRSEDEEAAEEDTEDNGESAEGDEKKKRNILPAFMGDGKSDESAKRGIATHNVLQFCDFELLKSEGAKSELDRLVQSEFLSQKDAERVRLNELERFTRSELYAEMVSAKKLHRELRFNVKLPASIFTSDGEKKKELSSRSVLVQGVIDCIIEHEDGSLHLIDYKTDRLTKEELSDISLAEKKLRESHSLQLSYYAEAIFRMFGRYPYKIGVYSMHLGKEIEIDKSLEM